MPSLSVILPVRNGAATIEQAVRSVLDSTFTDLELIIINDDSSDQTPDILNHLKVEEPRILWFDNPQPGLVSAINLGISKCRTSFIARMDADDICLPDRLKNQFQYLQKHPVDGVGGRVRILDGAGQPVSSLKRYESWVNDNLDADSIAAYRFVESPLVNPTVMARRPVFETGHRDGPWPEDYEFWLRGINQGFRFAKLPEVVLHWIDGPSRLTRNHSRYSPEAFDRCRRLYLLDGPLKNHRTIDLWGAGQTGKPWLRWLLEEGFTVRQVIDVNPRKVGKSIHDTPVIQPDAMLQADGTPLLVAVGAEGARDLIQEHLHPLGYIPGKDTWFVC